MKTCPVDNCRTRIGNGMVMCASHWHLVPIHLRVSLVNAGDMGSFGRARAAALCIAAVQPTPQAAPVPNAPAPRVNVS